jgi:NAD(P)-dependent dehydrogenase (short-subunit alcohol dehydrogenase family)
MGNSNIFDKNLLKRKTFVIAGGTSGIGSAVAMQISKLKGNVILIGRNLNKLKSVRNSLATSNDQKHFYYNCDLSNFDHSFELFTKIKNLHIELDGLVWTAGSELIKHSTMINSSDVHKIFDVISHGLTGSAKAFCSKGYWKKKGGSIVLISSVSSYRSSAGMLLYTAAKSALSGITKSLALDLSKNNVRVNNILLGAVKTEMHSRITKFLDDRLIEQYRDKHLLGFGKKDDVSALIIYLLSDASRWMTGSDIVLDGGLLTK